MKKFSEFFNYWTKNMHLYSTPPQVSATDENIAWTHAFLLQLPGATCILQGCVDFCQGSYFFDSWFAVILLPELAPDTVRVTDHFLNKQKKIHIFPSV